MKQLNFELEKARINGRMCVSRIYEGLDNDLEYHYNYIKRNKKKGTYVMTDDVTTEGENSSCSIQWYEIESCYSRITYCYKK